MLNQLDAYMSQFSLYAKFQSAYRKFHSCETALLRVRNDVLVALDNHLQVILVLLDFSAAFDTIDHGILISRLEHRFGIRGKALDWFRSYLCDRTQCVVVDSESSNTGAVRLGVPQGSILGPILFTLYSIPIEDIIISHGLDPMLFADDTQMYLACKEPHTEQHRLQLCIDEIHAWMIEKRLVLNDSKTEVIHIHSKFSKVDRISDLRVGTIHVKRKNNARNLGVIFDSHASMTSRITYL